MPQELKEYDSREYVRMSLKTDSYEKACQKAAALDQKTQAYWDELVKTNSSYDKSAFSKAVKLARLLGFEYKSISQLDDQGVKDLIDRVEVLENTPHSKEVSEAVLGGVEPKSLKLSEVESLFWSITSDRIMNKSEDQVRKWKNPRKRAIRNLTNLIGDKHLNDLGRDDVISFRDWWIKRITSDQLSRNSANKEIHAIKNMIEAVNEHERLGLDTQWLFSKTGLQDKGNKAKRPSFTSHFIRQHILDYKALSKLNAQAKAITQALAETGARPKEICCLTREDIILDHDIPHVKIRFKNNQELKTIYSERDIPLINTALKIFQKFPDGFPQYFNRSDSLSATVNKYLKGLDILPSSRHSLYSLRHSFQDRMTEVNMPDRVQCELFGHKFSRPEYGSGPSIELKREWMYKVALIHN